MPEYLVLPRSWLAEHMPEALRMGDGTAKKYECPACLAGPDVPCNRGARRRLDTTSHWSRFGRAYYGDVFEEAVVAVRLGQPKPYPRGEGA